MILLSRTVTAMGDGYTMGINISQVEARYGTNSAIFRTFLVADNKVILYVPTGRAALRRPSQALSATTAGSSVPGPDRERASARSVRV